MDLAGLLAVGILGLCAVLGVWGEMRADRHAGEDGTADAKLADRILEFDDVDGYMRGVLDRARADGLLR